MTRIALVLAFPLVGWSQNSNNTVEDKSRPALITPDITERLQLQIITLQEEIVRLTICLKHHLTLNQCGAWRNGQVMQMPESTSQSANAGESQPVENSSEKSAKPKEQDKEKATH